MMDEWIDIKRTVSHIVNPSEPENLTKSLVVDIAIRFRTRGDNLENIERVCLRVMCRWEEAEELEMKTRR